MAMQTAYPVEVGLDSPLEIDRWRVLQGILAIPHFIVLGVLGIVFYVLTIVCVFTAIFTGDVPEGIYNFRAMFLRYAWRVESYAFFMHDAYPPFEFSGAAADPGGFPATLSFQHPESMSRWLWLVKGLLLIPHFIVLVLMEISLYVVLPLSFLIVLITGKWPEGLRNYVVGFMRWGLRVASYFSFMNDVYPPFTLE